MAYSNDISHEDLLRLKKEIAYVTSTYSDCQSGPIRESIFHILDELGTLILYPFEEEELWGIYVSKDEKNIFILNSAMTLEKMIFAAAHEIAHSLDIAKVSFEIITADLITEYTNHFQFGDVLKRAERIANRFAAELLIDESLLLSKLDSYRKRYSSFVQAVLLSDYFLVPYKAIIKRFAEIGYITNESEIEELLSIDTHTVNEISERYECRKRNIEIRNEKKLGGYIDKALLLYENELSTYTELKNYLALLDIEPERYDIFDDRFDYYSLLNEGPIDIEEESDA